MSAQGERPQFEYDQKLAEQRLAEWLLPHRVIDLSIRIQPDADRYSVLGISQIVRSLLLDAMNVESLARRRHAIPSPTFEFTPFDITSDTVGGLYWVSDGERHLEFRVADADFETPTVSASLKEFLRAPVAQYRDSPVSVKEYVRAYAHVLGGVHLGVPKTEAEQVMQAVAARIEGENIGWAAALRHVGGVTFRAMVPIMDAIERAGWEMRENGDAER